MNVLVGWYRIIKVMHILSLFNCIAQGLGPGPVCSFKYLIRNIGGRVFQAISTINLKHLEHKAALFGKIFQFTVLQK